MAFGFLFLPPACTQDQINAINLNNAKLLVILKIGTEYQLPQLTYKAPGISLQYWLQFRKKKREQFNQKLEI